MALEFIAAQYPSTIRVHRDGHYFGACDTHPYSMESDPRLMFSQPFCTAVFTAIPDEIPEGKTRHDFLTIVSSYVQESKIGHWFEQLERLEMKPF